MTKEILLYNFGEVSKDAVLSTVEVFDTTLIALKDGGDAPLDLSMTEFEAIPEMENKETKDQLEKVMSSWNTFKQKIESVLENNDASSMNYIIDNNTKLLDEMDAAVVMMQHNAEEKIARLYWIIGLGILVSVLIFIVAITKDITERKRMEEMRLMALFAELNPAPVIRFGKDGKVLMANRVAHELFGRLLVTGMSLPSILSDIEGLDLNTCIRKGEILSHSVEIGNRFFHFMFRGVPDLGIGQIYGSDITEHKRMEHELGDRMKELQCLYGIGYIAERPRITLDELYQEAVNLLPSGWQYPEDTCARITTNDKEFKTENYRDTEWKQSSDITVDGVREGVVEVSYLEEKPELDEGPFTKEERLLIDAITERLALTIKRKQMKEDLEQKVEELQDAYRKLKELDQMKDNFLSTVSHELRTPLTSIKGFAEILLDYEEDRETQREFLTIINNESERLTRLIDDFLDLARIEAGRMNWQDTTVAIPETIEAASNATRALSAKKTLAVDITLEPDLPTIWGDRDRLVQVVTNLLSNAIKFTPEGGKIRVGAEVIKDSEPDDGSDVIRVSISDTGIGIAPEEYQTIFEKFRQAGDTLTDKPKGTGLGLPICKEIVEHYGGRIWVESEPGRGSTFYFTLPVVEKVEAALPKVKEEKAAVAIKAGRTILVVDDEAPIRRYLNHELSGRGYQVIEASGGREAIALAREHHPDLITLDVLMPDIDGLDVTAVLKSDPDTRDIPILIISVVEEKEKGYRLGVSDYIVKPFRKKVLMDRITQLLGQAQKTILVADADRALAKTIKSELEKRGFSVYVANDGAKALKVVESNRVDLIVLDTVMPKVDGYEVMKLLKDKPDTADIPIIVLTDVEINGGGVKALSLGVAEYVTKSGGLSKLFDGIENILSGKSTD